MNILTFPFMVFPLALFILGGNAEATEVQWGFVIIGFLCLLIEIIKPESGMEFMFSFILLLAMMALPTTGWKIFETYTYRWIVGFQLFDVLQGTKQFIAMPKQKNVKRKG